MKLKTKSNPMISVHISKEIFGDARKYAYGFKAYVPEGIDDVGRQIISTVWSPVVWGKGHRKQSNFISADYLALDFDSPEMNLAEAMNSFCDMKHVIGLTKNHQKIKGDNPACDRFRVVIPFEKRITDLKTYRYNMMLIMKKYPVDEQCKDGARFFYPCTEIVSVVQEGFDYDVISEIPEEFEQKKESFGVTKCLDRMSIHPIKKHLFKHYKDLNRNTAIYGACKDLTTLGYQSDQIFSLVTGWISELDEVSRLPDDEIKTILFYLNKKDG